VLEKIRFDRTVRTFRDWQQYQRRRWYPSAEVCCHQLDQLNALQRCSNARDQGSYLRSGCPPSFGAMRLGSNKSWEQNEQRHREQRASGRHSKQQSLENSIEQYAVSL
jgi:hypothetical protein